MLEKTKIKILEILTIEPIHGYGLKKKLNISISSIYAHLKELTDKGFTEIWKKEDKKIYYRITDKGREILSLLK